MRSMLKTLQYLALALLVVCSVSMSAQTITAAVNGVVTDPSGAVVQNAKVTATNVDTGVSTSTTTNNDGIYAIRFLQIGNYKVTIEAPGFAATTVGPFVLETGQSAKFDAKLTMQGQNLNIDVASETVPLINTENATLATTLDTRAIDNIPIVGRDIVALTMFLPGAVSTNPNGFVGQSAIAGQMGTQTVSVNGNRQQTNQYLLDGMNINQTLDDTPGYNPSVDAIGQVQVISANANAEYGNVNGGDILYTTKSGSNTFHGSAYYFLGDDALNANSWGNKRNSTNVTPKQSFTRNIFGGTFGGPIWKDKLFFFGDYQGGRYHTGGAANATVFSDAMRGQCATCTAGFGDFSDLLDTTKMGTTKLVQLYDAAGTTPGVGFNNPYVGNRGLPISNPVATYLFAHPELYPRANQIPTYTNNTPTSNNYRGLSKSRAYGDQYDVKVDWNATDRDRVFVRYSSSDSGTTSLNPLPTQFTSAPTFPVRGVAINEVHTFSASLVNDFHAGYTRIQNNGATLLDTRGLFGLNGNATLGIGGGSFTQPYAGFSAQSMGTSGSPQTISASFGTDITTLGSANTGTNYTDNTFLYSDNLTWLRGKHSFKFGVQFQRQQQNNFYPGNDGSMGGDYYEGNGTSSPANNATDCRTATNANPCAGGYNGADFVLNRVSFLSKGSVAGPVGMRSWRDAYFVQDDWKVLPNLTLSLGVRYEYIQPIYEVNNKMATVDPSSPSKILVDGPANQDLSRFGVYAGNVAVASTRGYGRGLVDPYYKSLMPRIGFAYSVTPRWVWRGGYGIQNFMEGTGANLRMTTNVPFQATYQGNATPVTATTPGVYFNSASPLAGSTAPGATGTAFNVWNRKIKPTFIGEYSLTTEYQLTNTASVQVGYLGESGQHLVTANAGNQLLTPCYTDAAGTTLNPVGTGKLQTAPNNIAVCRTLAPYSATPYVGYNGNIRYTDSNAMMNYNALQATFRQRAWHGLQYTVNYTYSHAMTNSVGFYGVPSVSVQSAYSENTYNMHNEYGPAGQDVRHGINWNMVYDLPLGRGRMFGGNMPLILDELVGGWKVGMTGIAYTGFPVTIATPSNNSATNGNSQRANHYRPLKIVNRDINHWFGTDPSATPCTAYDTSPGGDPNKAIDNGVCAYGVPSNGTFGSSRPTSERAPGFQTYGASVTKDFTVWREHKVNFRADADNVFNSAYWSNPANSMNGSFGQITSVRSGPRNLQLSMKYHF